MKKLFNILAFVCLALFIVSCSNSDDTLGTSNETSSSLITNKKSNNLSYQNAVDLGKQHNLGLSDILKKLQENTNPSLSSKDVIRKAIEDKRTKEILNGEFQINFDVENPDLELLLAKTENKLLKNIYNETLNEINTSQSVPDFNRFCKNQIAFIDKNLEGDEKFMAQAFIEVSKNSFQYWAPKEIGGTGEGQEFLKYTSNTSKKVNWRNVIRNDGIGLGVAFIGNSIALAFGPMGGAAYIAGLAWGTISSSAFGGF
ncbi:hypothetical protein [Chryseobacterium paridis]|uniref:Uncharacterized protein n=1 Tax=Chryseobacterium paridis TaxID=2800328 RepID=A0ABS1FZV8_9FLAO|nr:hypothetical protein [Chryseobacterium paridis]MBK1897976.1 hypothetical protein [Chryseobacterium paridis]